MKILVIFTGGTIGSSRTDKGISPDNSNSFALINGYENIHNAEFTAIQPYTILSENLNGTHLTKLYDCIKSNYSNNYDGIIVTHGTDTLQYTSAFLCYAFGLCDIPIVVVSANFPLSDSRSNGFENFSSAVDFINSGLGKGVFTAYKNNGEPAKIHRGSQLLPHLPYSDDIHSIFGNYFCEIIDHSIVLNKSYTEEQLPHTKFNTNLGSQSDILFFSPYVGCSFPNIGDNVKAILLTAYHSGTLNTSDCGLSHFCRLARRKDIPVFLTGDIQGFEYESKAEYRKLGIKVLEPCSPITAYIKLWMSL